MIIRNIFVITCVALSGLYPLRVYAQHDHHTSAVVDEDSSPAQSFITRAREATQQFQDLEAAIAAGYRQIGPDMPNMGEHWINPRMVTGSSLDPAEPSVLTYLRVKGQPVLTGVAYTVPVFEGESPPALPFSGASWHYHTGTVEEELIGSESHAMHDEEDVRLAMLHAWIWTTNPDGIFTTDNWGLSFLRLGLPIPETASPEAAKALFLLEGGVEYYLNLIGIASQPSTAEEKALRELFERYRGLVAEQLATSEPTRLPIASFSTLWKDLWTQIPELVTEPTREGMQSLSP